MSPFLGVGEKGGRVARCQGVKVAVVVREGGSASPTIRKYSLENLGWHKLLNLSYFVSFA